MFDSCEPEAASSVYSHMCLNSSCLGVSIHKYSKITTQYIGQGEKKKKILGCIHMGHKDVCSGN